MHRAMYFHIITLMVYTDSYWGDVQVWGPILPISISFGISRLYVRNVCTTLLVLIYVGARSLVWNALEHAGWDGAGLH